MAIKNSSLYFFLLLFSLTACQQDNSTDLATTHFKEVTASHSGLKFANNILENDTLNYYTFPYLYMGGGVAIGDINNDGLSDVFLTGNMVPNKLYLNKGNLQFEDISEQAGISGDNRWYTGVTMADVNHDGWLDIYLCVSGKHPPFNNQLFINNQDQTFTEKAQAYGIDDESTSIQATFFDFDQDGFFGFIGRAIIPKSRFLWVITYYYDKMLQQ